ncbi:MAG: hypothetical protein WAU91_19760 [Desulfatitalea sp.]
MNDKGDIDVGGNHLQIDLGTGGLAPQEGLPRKHMVDDSRGVIVVVVRGHPIADTWQVGGTIDLVRKLPRYLGWDFSGFISYEVCAAVDRGNASKAATVQAKLSGVRFKPRVEAEIF